MITFNVHDRSEFKCFDQYLANLRRGGSNLFTVLAVGTKCDPDGPRAITKEEAEAFFAKKKPPIPYVETSAVHNIGVNEASETAVSLFLKDLREPRPSHECIIA